MEQLYSNFIESKITRGVFLEFSKTFDTINLEILSKKLGNYNFSIASPDLIENYLSQRKQYMCIREEISSQNITMRVPQGGFLGSLLFLPYVNALLKSAPELSYILFADETTY